MSKWPECELAGEVRKGEGRLSGARYAARLCRVSRFYVTLDTCQACPVPALIAAAQDALNLLRALYPYAAGTEPLWCAAEVKIRDELKKALAALERLKGKGTR